MDVFVLTNKHRFTRLLFAPQGVDQEYTQEQNNALYEVLANGISHLSKWKSSFLLFLAWKYQVCLLQCFACITTIR